MISYAGVNLPIPRADICEWVEQNISPDDVYDFQRRDWPGRNLQGMAFPGSTRYRPIKPGTLYWPTGASRWAVAYFFATDEILDQIYAALANAYGIYHSAPLVLSKETKSGAGVITTDSINGSPEVISTNMWMLPVRPIQQAVTDSDNGVYLLTLVDDRFFWWNSATVTVTFPKDWPTLYNTFANALCIQPPGGLQIDPIPAAYLAPGYNFTHLFNEACPPVLDSIAYNVGQRIVRDLNGGLHAYNVNSSFTIFNDNGAAFPFVGYKQGGGQMALDPGSDFDDLASMLPGTVAFSFPVARGTEETPLEIPPYQLPVSLSSLVIRGFRVTGNVSVKVFQDSAAADYTVPGPRPVNYSQLFNLVNQFATDWYSYQFSPADVKYVGILQWEPEGLSDSIEWTYKADEGHREQGECSTRIQRPAFNDQTEQLSHQAALVGSYKDDPFWAIITAGPAPYSWEEVMPQPGGAWKVMPQGRNGSRSEQPAYELNGATDVPYGTIVVMWYGHLDTGAPDQEFIFDAGPTGGGGGGGPCCPPQYCNNGQADRKIYAELLAYTAGSGGNPGKYDWQQSFPLADGTFSSGGGLSGTASSFPGIDPNDSYGTACNCATHTTTGCAKWPCQWQFLEGQRTVMLSQSAEDVWEDAAGIWSLVYSGGTYSLSDGTVIYSLTSGAWDCCGDNTILRTTPASLAPCCGSFPFSAACIEVPCTWSFSFAGGTVILNLAAQDTWITPGGGAFDYSLIYGIQNGQTGWFLNGISNSGSSHGDIVFTYQPSDLWNCGSANALTLTYTDGSFAVPGAVLLTPGTDFCAPSFIELQGVDCRCFTAQTLQNNMLPTGSIVTMIPGCSGPCWNILADTARLRSGSVPTGYSGARNPCEGAGLATATFLNGVLISNT
jgi:hypothetical protein